MGAEIESLAHQMERISNDSKGNNAKTIDIKRNLNRRGDIPGLVKDHVQKAIS